MAYKITKYKGKTKIKDTKTGKSAEINIEKFMNGGYKTLSDSYEYGGQKSVQKFDCGGQFTVGTPEYNDCMDKERRATLFDDAGEIDYNTDPNTGEPLNPNNNITQQNQGIVTEDTLGPGEIMLSQDDIDNAEDGYFDEDYVAPTKQQLVANNQHHRATKGIDYGTEDLYREVGLDPKKQGQTNLEGRRDMDYTIPNPYAGVDIPTAANHLGSSIENKSAIGMAASSLKILAGLGRNVVTGLGNQKRYNRVMKDYYTKQKNNRNPVQYLEYGGKKDEELATGEYMHGVENENTEDYNAEIEKGEYFQSNEGDIAEVVGDKHSQGGEKIQMEAEDRVLSDKLKLGNKTAKMLASKYDLKLKAKNTYADVLDKFRKKMKLDTLLEEEADILKKIGEQSKVEDATTKGFNLQVLTQKQEEIKKQKHPIEEQRKDVFEELFNIQESTKPKKKVKEDNTFEYGGKLESLAKEYNIPMDRAKQLVEEFSKGGKKVVPQYETASGDCPDGYIKNAEGQCVPIDTGIQSSNNREYPLFIEDPAQEFSEDELKNIAKHYGFTDLGEQKEFIEGIKQGNIHVPKSVVLEGLNTGKQSQTGIKGTFGKLTDEQLQGSNLGFLNDFLMQGELNDYSNPEQVKAFQEAYNERYKRRTGRDYTFSVRSDQQFDGQLGTRTASVPLFGDTVNAKKQGRLNLSVLRGLDPEYANRLLSDYGVNYDDISQYVDDDSYSFLNLKNDNPDPEIPVQQLDEVDLGTIKNNNEEVIDYVPEGRENAGMFPYLFPDESPLPPTALQGTIKAERRFDRVRPSEIDVEPYLQDIRDREEAQVQSLEGLSPNVRAAVLANMRSNNQRSESDTRNKIDTANIASQEKAIYTNAQIQQREENASEQDRLAYEGRQYRAQALTDNDLNNYFNQLQAVNKQRFMDIHNLNLVNATNEDVFFDGQTFRRKTSDRDILRQVKV